MKTNLIFQCDVRQLTTEKGVVVEGIAAPYNKRSQQMGRFVEVLGEKCLMFDETRAVYAFYAHDTDKILGSTKNQTLELENRSDGLYFRLTLPNTTLGKDVAELVTRQDVCGVSVGMKVESDTWDENSETKMVIRTINRAKLIEVSLTPFPAYPDTEVAVRSGNLNDLFTAYSKEATKPQTYPVPSPEQIEFLRSV